MNALKAALALSAATTILATYSVASAQEADSAEENSRTLDVVTVTSQKRAQSLQDVPLSVAVTQGEEINEQIVTNLEDLTDGTPTVTVTRTPVSDSIYIRGVGSGSSVGFQQSVGTFVDGVYRGRGAAARNAFLDLERIEILRGPQPVYFGNSTVGGAFNIVSKGPSDELEVNLITSYEFEADEWVTEIGVGGPISDTLGFRLAYNHTESEGWMTDTIQNERVPAVENDAFRGTLEFEPTANFDATLKLEYSENFEDGGTLQVIECNAADVPPPLFGPSCNPGVFLAPGFEDNLDFNLSRGGVLSNGQAQEDSNALDMLNGSLSMNYDLSDTLTLTSVTGLVDYESRLLVDVDSGPTFFAQADRQQDFNQFSQELRLQSDSDDRLNFMAGVYYEDASLDYLQNAANAAGPHPALLNGVRSLGTYDQEQQTIALFGSVTYEITDSLDLTVGARWSEVETEGVKVQRTLDINGQDTLPPAAIANFGNPLISPNPRDEHDLSGSRTDDAFTPSIELQWYPTDGVMVYGSYKEAFKGGGFDPNIQLASLALPTANDPNGGFEFDAEDAESWEIGAKTTLFDGTVNFNIAAFQTEFTNLQVQAFDSASSAFVTGNAGASESKGVEIDSVWRATDNLTLNGNISFLDSTYTDFADAQCNGVQAAAFVPTPAVPQCTVAIDGQTTPFAPDYSGSVGFNFDFPITNNLEFVSSGAVTFTSEFAWGQNPDPVEIQDGYEKFDLRAGISGNDGQWELAFVGKNLTDELTFRFLGELPGPSGRFANVDRGQQLGVQFKFNH